MSLGRPGAGACRESRAVAGRASRSCVLLTPAGWIVIAALGAPVGAAPPESSIAAVVNGVAISDAAVERALEERVPRISGHGSISEGRRAVLRAQVVEELITEELIVQEATRLGVTADQPAIDAEVAKIRGRFKTSAEYTQALARNGLSEQDVRRGVKRHLVVRRMVDREVTAKVAVTEADLRAYYDADPLRFVVPEQVRLRHLLIAVDPAASTAEWKAAQARAADLARQARRAGSGTVGFVDLVRTHSQHAASREQGGDLGWVHRGQLEEDQEAVIFALAPGQASEPVRTLYGFAVYHVEARKPRRALAYEEINAERLADELRAAEIDRRRSAWLNELRVRATVKTGSTDER